MTEPCQLMNSFNNSKRAVGVISKVKSQLSRERSQEHSPDQLRKMLRNFNQVTSKYQQLVVSLGGMSDGEPLREEMKRTLQQAHELVFLNKTILLPYVKDNNSNSNSNSTTDNSAVIYTEDCESNIGSKRGGGNEYQNLWCIYTCSVQLLLILMSRALDLQRKFPIHSGHPLFINTGLDSPLGNGGLSLEQLDISAVERKVLEKEEFCQLEREVSQMAEMLDEIQKLLKLPLESVVDGNIGEFPDQPSWEMGVVAMEMNSVGKFSSSSTLSNNSQANSVADLTQITTINSSFPRKKCLYVVAASIGMLVIFVAIILIVIFVKPR